MLIQQLAQVFMFRYRDFQVSNVLSVLSLSFPNIIIIIVGFLGA